MWIKLKFIYRAGMQWEAHEQEYPLFNQRNGAKLLTTRRRLLQLFLHPSSNCTVGFLLEEINGRWRWDKGKERTISIHLNQGLILELPCREKGIVALSSWPVVSSYKTRICVPQRVTAWWGRKLQITCVRGTLIQSFLLRANEMGTKKASCRKFSTWQFLDYPNLSYAAWHMLVFK